MPHHLTSSQVKTSASKFDETHSAVKTKPIPVKTNASNRRLFGKIEDKIGTHLCRYWCFRSGFWSPVKGWATELRSLREEQIEGLNSSGFILLACINIEATTRKAMEVWILQFIEICLRILQMLVFEKRKRK
jgi:hypothetical protein